MIQRTVELDPIRWQRLIAKLDEAHELGLSDYEDAGDIDAAEYWTGGDWLAKRSFLYGTLVIYRPETRDSATTYIQRSAVSPAWMNMDDAAAGVSSW